jgi:RNA polymerase sigma-70 factor (ECF subfamily)
VSQGSSSEGSSTEPGKQQRRAVLDLYDEAVSMVYGYLLSRCGHVGLAEDLTAETFLAAVDAVRREDPPPLSVPWLVGVARHKLADHWRRQAREQRGLYAVGTDPSLGSSDVPGAEIAADAWDLRLDALQARATLQRLAPQHRAALTLRYLDDLPVVEVATILDRTVHATEGLLVRARAAFRTAYAGQGDGDE